MARRPGARARTSRPKVCPLTRRGLSAPKRPGPDPRLLGGPYFGRAPRGSPRRDGARRCRPRFATSPRVQRSPRVRGRSRHNSPMPLRHVPHRSGSRLFLPCSSPSWRSTPPRRSGRGRRAGVAGFFTRLRSRTARWASGWPARTLRSAPTVPSVYVGLEDPGRLGRSTPPHHGAVTELLLLQHRGN